MKHISLNDYLCDKSNWPKRLLGWEKYQLHRSAEAVAVEYDGDRYAPLLMLGSRDVEDYKVEEFRLLNMRQDDPIFVSFGDEVFKTDVRTARIIWYGIIQSTVKRFASGTICELGCGYGFNLHLLGNGAYGGEYSQNAVCLGQRLGLSVQPFNYYRTEDYSFIRPGSTVLTVHSIEQIPSARAFVENSIQLRDKVSEFIHLEPCVLPERRTLMGMIRNRYTELIDFNHDLVQLLRGRSDVEILHFEADMFGLHPLAPSCLTVWRFRKAEELS